VHERGECTWRHEILHFGIVAQEVNFISSTRSRVTSVSNGPRNSALVNGSINMNDSIVALASYVVHCSILLLACVAI